MRKTVVTVAVSLALSAAALAQTATVPAGTQFEARLDQELNTKNVHDGDKFTMTEHEGFFHHAPPALKGAHIDGHVENVSPAHPGHGASMNVIIDDVVFADGSTAPLDAKITSMKVFEPKTHHLRDAALVVGGAVAGHIAAKRTGHSHGALAGAAAGVALATTLKSDIDVKRGTIVHLRLNGPISPGTNG